MRTGESIRAAGRCAPRLILLLLPAGLAACLGACGPRKPAAHPIDPTKPVDRVLMEPIVIQAYEEGGGLKFDAYDAEGLFDEGLRQLEETKPGLALQCFEKLLAEFPTSKYASASLFNAAYSHEMLALKADREKNLESAVKLYDRVASEHADGPDALDALFRKGYCLEALGRPQQAAALYAKLLERGDLSTQDKIEIKTRIGKIFLEGQDLIKAEEILRENLLYFNEVSEDERIENTFYAAQAQFEIAEISRMQFEQVGFSTEEKLIREELEKKLELMLKAKDAYIETIKIGNYHWAAAAGYRVGMLLRTLFDQIMAAPLPAAINTAELKEIYFEALGEKVRPLLGSALNVWEKTLLMAERVGYSGEWLDRIEAAVDETAKLTEK